jgi:hypothetical protein
LPQPGSSPRWWAAVLFACIVIAGLESIRLGMDGNWDLRNYHYYNAYAFLNGRLAWDIAPAMLQTYHNPLLELPFYFLVQADVAPRVISFLLAASTGIAAFFLVRTTLLLFPAGMAGRRTWIAAAIAIGVTGSAGHGVLGTTTNEWPPAALAIAALYVLTSSTVRDGSPSNRALALAGVLAGIAAGLKLTNASYCVGIAFAVMAFGPLRDRLRRAAWVSAFTAAGLVLSYGFWGVALYHEFGNPFFPYFNAIFHSPWWEPVSFFDRNYGPRDALQALFFPFYFATQSRLVGEQPFVDWRFAAMFVLVLACAVKFALTRDRTAAGREVVNGWRVLCAFALASYLAWLKVFGYYRYLVPVEFISGIVIVGCALYLLKGTNARRWGVAILALALIATTHKPDWGRLEYRKHYLDVAVPELPARSLVIIGVSDPMAYVIPFFRADARFVSPHNNFLRVGQKNLLARRATEVIARHDGPIFALDVVATSTIEESLAPYGLARDLAGCRGITSNHDSNALRVCPVHRVAS